jgi:hypothetical protein
VGDSNAAQLSVDRFAGVALIFGSLLRAAAAQTVVADLPIPSDGTERAAFLPAAQPRATVILLAGGEGIVQIDGAGNTRNNNFLIPNARDVATIPP